MEKLSIKRLILSQSKYIFIGFVFTVISIGLNLLFPLVTKTIIDQAIPDHNWQLLVISLFGLVVIPFLVSLFQALGNLYNHRVGGYVTDQLRKTIFYKLTHLSPNIYHNLKAGDVAGRVYSCGEIGDLYITQSLIPAVYQLILLVGIFFMMFYLNWKLTFISFILLPLMFVLSNRSAQKARKLAQKVMHLQQELNVFTTELVLGLKTVQMFNQEDHENQKQFQWIDEYRKVRNQTFIFDRFADLFVSGHRFLGLGIVFAFGSWLIFNGQLTVGALVAFTVYFRNCLEPWKKSNLLM